MRAGTGDARHARAMPDNFSGWMRDGGMAREREPRIPAAAAPEKWPQLGGEIRDGRHVLAVRVYYEDTDFTGIVYHASFLRFMERGRTEYLRRIGAAHRDLFEQTAREAPGFAFVVRTMRIDYRKAAHMDDVLEIVTEPGDVK